MKITIDGKAFECLEWKITTNTDANPKINPADLRLKPWVMTFDFCFFDEHEYERLLKKYYEGLLKEHADDSRTQAS